MGKFLDIIHGLKPTVMMVAVQIASAGVNIFYKIAGSDGMSLQVLIAYRFLFAAAAIVPIALIIERKNRPRLTWKILFLAFFSALFGGSMAQNLYAQSLVLTSATFAAAMTNLIPAITFMLAIFFRMERLGLRTAAGKAKVIGTVLCIGGAMLLTFYKGCVINIWSTHSDILHKNDGHVATAHHKSIDKILGPLLAFACCFTSSIALIFQAKMSELYPCHYSTAAMISVMGSIQAVVYALCVERDWSQWRLGWNLRLLCAAYMGIVATGIMWVFVMVTVRMRGPLFVSVFKPLLLVLVAIAGSLILNEKFHLGSVLGAVVIICGLYIVLWGKSKEVKITSRLVPMQSFAKEPIHEQGTDQETARESFTSYVYGSGVMAVAPSFVPEGEILDVFDEGEEGDDIEANISISNSK